MGPACATGGEGTAAASGATVAVSGETVSGTTEPGGSGGPDDAGSTGVTGATGEAPEVDLTVESVSWEPAAPVSGQAVTLRATIRNLGAAPLAATARVAFTADGAPAGEAELAALAPGAVVTLDGSAPWAAPGSGSVQIAAQVDADGAIAEADEGNNAADATLTVTAAACRTVGPWSSSAPFADEAHVSHPLPSFASDGFYYVHTKTKDGADERVLYSARANADGSLQPWQVASPDHGGGPHGFTAIDVAGEPFHFRNGHIARYELDAQGIMQGDVTLVEADVETAFGGNKYVWDSAVFAAPPGGPRRVIHLGGFSFAGYTYRPDVYRSAVPVEPAFTDAGLDHPAERPGKAAFVGIADYGFLITGESGGARLWSSRLAADGSLAPWVQLPDLPPGTGNERGDLIALGRTLLAVRGATVVCADVSPEGALSPWSEAPALPEAPVDITWGEGHLEGASHGVIGESVYVTGTKQVHHARLEPVACAN